MGAVDWKPASKTFFTFEETVMHYRGDTKSLGDDLVPTEGWGDRSQN